MGGKSFGTMIILAGLLMAGMARGDILTDGVSPAVRGLYDRLEAEPQNPQVWRGLGLQLVAEGQLRAAVGPLKQALALDQAAGNAPHTGIGHNELGRLYRALGDQAGTSREREVHHHRAIAAFRAAEKVERRIGNPMAQAVNLRALARLYRGTGQMGLARHTFYEAAVAFQDAQRGHLAQAMLTERSEIPEN